MHNLLLSLPYEVLLNIVQTISFDDYYNLGQSCRQLSFLLKEEGITKAVLQSKIPHSNEAREALLLGTGYAQPLRRAAKRYEALATARPYVVATMGFCEEFLYCRGFLCYTLDKKIRVLNLHGSPQLETIVSIQGLLDDAMRDASTTTRGRFQVLYYADGIMSCLYTNFDAEPTARLIAFRLNSQTILLTHQLVSTDKLFVRHNSEFLYYGTHSELGNDGFKKWVISGFKFSTSKWFDEKIHLCDMVGSEIGSTVCFEFYDGFFYALSNQTSFEVEEIDWTSFYHCARFPLASPRKKLLEKTENEKMWRRQHQEGPIDDRWTVLRLDVDETNGELRIVEARKEWYLGSSRSQRTYYTTPIIFPDPDRDEDVEIAHLIAATADTGFALPTNSAWVPPPSSSGTADSSSSSSSSSAGASSASSSSSSSATTTAETNKFSIEDLPDQQLAKLLHPDDHPNHIKAPPRLPQHTHPANDGSSQLKFTLTKSRIRTYHTSCSTFMDLVDDPLPSDPYSTPRLRLRSGTRYQKPPLLDEKNLLRPPSTILEDALRELYRDPPITFWPPAQNPHHPNKHVDEVYKLLNPPTHLGYVEGTADERSIVYATGPPGGALKALIFISFDPSTKLEGLKQWGGLGSSQGGYVGLKMKAKGIGEGPHINGRAASEATDREFEELGREWDDEFEREAGGNQYRQHPETPYVDVEEAERPLVVDRKGKGRADDMNSMLHFDIDNTTMDERGVGRPTCSDQGGSGRGWIWQEKAMYRDINLGLYFGLEKVDGGVLAKW